MNVNAVFTTGTKTIFADGSGYIVTSRGIVSVSSGGRVDLPEVMEISTSISMPYHSACPIKRVRTRTFWVSPEIIVRVLFDDGHLIVTCS